MKKFILSILGAVLSIGAATGASAHHSPARFDFRNTVSLTGIVKKATFSNPHAQIVLEVTDEERGTRDIEFESHSRNNYHMQGFRPDMVKVGDTITVRIWPMRDGTDGGYITALITADGKPFGFWPTTP